jgi:hypothetical protein
VCWSIVTKENPVGSPFYGPFPSDSITKAKKDVNVHSCNYTTEIRKIFEAIILGVQARGIQKYMLIF